MRFCWKSSSIHPGICGRLSQRIQGLKFSTAHVILTPVMENERKAKVSAWQDKGDDLTRILALSDGVFAIALTLLAIDLILPELDPANISIELPRALLALIPKFLIFALAFYLVIVKWMAHRRIFQYIVRYDSRLLWLNNWFLLFIAFMPVPAAVLGRYPTQPAALIFFGVTQIITTFSQWALWSYVTRGHRLVDETLDDEMIRFFNRRYVWQIVGLAVFTAISVINVWITLVLMIGFGIAFQLYVGYQRRRHDAAHSSEI